MHRSVTGKRTKVQLGTWKCIEYRYTSVVGGMVSWLTRIYSGHGKVITKLMINPFMKGYVMASIRYKSSIHTSCIRAGIH